VFSRPSLHGWPSGQQIRRRGRRMTTLRPSMGRGPGMRPPRCPELPAPPVAVGGRRQGRGGARRGVFECGEHSASAPRARDAHLRRSGVSVREALLSGGRCAKKVRSAPEGAGELGGARCHSLNQSKIMEEHHPTHQQLSLCMVIMVMVCAWRSLRRVNACAVEGGC
jgi:hypothetical protein